MNEMTSDIIKFCQMLLPRWASFVVGINAEGGANGRWGLPFQGAVWSVEWRLDEYVSF